MWWDDMSFSKRLIAVRKSRDFSQKALSEAVGVHISQIRRYEAGTCQPTAEVIKNIAIALHTSADSLLFEPGEREPSDELKYHFEAISKLDDDEKMAVRLLLEGILIKHDTKRWQAQKI